MNKIEILFKPIELKGVLKYICGVVLAVASCISAVMLYMFLGKTEYAMISKSVYIIGASVILIFGMFGYITKVAKNSLPLIGVIISGCCALYFGYSFISFSGLNSYASKEEMLCAMGMSAILLFSFFNSLFAFYFNVVSDYKNKKVSDILNKGRIGKSFAVSATLFFITLIFIPAQTFFGSYSDFHFPYQIIFKSLIGSFLFAFIITALVLMLANKEKAFAVIHNLLAGIVIAIYIQYMFLNSTVGTIGGNNYDWKSNAAIAIVDMIVWIGIIYGLIVAAVKNAKSVKYVSYVVIFLGLIQLSTYGTLLISSDRRCFDYSAVYYDFDKQYTVGSENVIVFIIDAADNSYAKTMYDENAEVLNEYKDFTLYTDTCSVYDYTNRSLLQMVTNFPFDNTMNNYETRENAWELDTTKEFFDRFHNNGYEINFYNFDNENTTGVLGKIDNARAFDPKTEKMEYVSYKTIKDNMNKLSMFTYLPNILKSNVNVQDITFEYAIHYKSSNGVYENDKFENDLSLVLDDGGKYVIYQHLFGCHEPNDNIETAEYCMEIIGEYMRQLRELGVYDNTTVIVTADHGSHDDTERKGANLRATTPMFMIKLKNQNQNEVELNNAPIYHMDIMPTMLYSAGLYESGDSALFGKTIFDYKEGELRERIWYDRVYDANYPDIGAYNTYYGFTYVGDTEEFERVVDSKENCTVYPVNKYND